MVLDYSPSSPPVVEGIYDQRKLPCFRKQKVWWTTDVVTRFPSVLGRESPGIMSPSGSLDQELKEDSRYFMGVDLFFCSTLGSKCGVLRTAVVRVLRRRVLQPATYQRMERKEVTTEYGHKLPFLQNLTLGTDVGRTSCLYLRVYNGFSPHLVPPVRPSFFLTSSEDPRPTL